MSFPAAPARGDPNIGVLLHFFVLISGMEPSQSKGIRRNPFRDVRIYKSVRDTLARSGKYVAQIHRSMPVQDESLIILCLSGASGSEFGSKTVIRHGESLAKSVKVWRACM